MLYRICSVVRRDETSPKGDGSIRRYFCGEAAAAEKQAAVAAAADAGEAAAEVGADNGAHRRRFGDAGLSSGSKSRVLFRVAPHAMAGAAGGPGSGGVEGWREEGTGRGAGAEGEGRGGESAGTRRAADPRGLRRGKACGEAPARGEAAASAAGAGARPARRGREGRREGGRGGVAGSRQPRQGGLFRLLRRGSPRERLRAPPPSALELGAAPEALLRRDRLPSAVETSPARWEAWNGAPKMTE